MRNKLMYAFLSLAFTGFAQNTPVKELKGRVYSSDRDVVGVVVQNITTAEAVITNVEGFFSITVQRNDTLVFSAVQFQRKQIVIEQTLFDAGFIAVPLDEFVNELEEVVVTPYNLSGDLSKDVVGLKLEKDVSARALGLPNADAKILTQSERKLHEASSGAYSIRDPLKVGLNPLINAITGRTKRLKKRVEIDARYAQTQHVQEYYVDSLFIDMLKIPQEKIDDFMYFCEVDEQFQTVVGSQDKLKILDYLMVKSRAYRKNNHID